MARTQLPDATEPARRRPLAAAEVDGRLREALHELQLAERNAVLWFGEVLERRLFRELGFSSIYHYAGEALGFSRPRTAQFIRLCESLEGLPALKDSLAAGEVSWTKAREIAKVATPQTESAWVDLARRESRRKLERRVRMLQTHSRARRRNGSRQLGLADDAQRAGLADDAREPVPAAGEVRPGHAGARSRADSLGVSLADPPSAQSACSDDATAPPVAVATLPSNVAFGEIPVTLSLRFSPEQYARYEAILEGLRKRGERGAREELILAGLEALLVEAGPGSADSPSPRGAGSSPGESKPASARGAAPDSDRGAKTSVHKATAASVPPAASVSPRKKGAESKHRVASVSPRNSKPAYQIVVQQCEDCGRARVLTSRGAMPVAPASAEAMRCDARVLRTGEVQPSGERSNVGGDHPSGEESRLGGKHPSGERNRAGEMNHPGGRNRATIPPGRRREVMARDGYRCRTPGCGSARFLEVHHVVPRSAGGSNRPDNLVTLCSACHRLTHSLGKGG